MTTIVSAMASTMDSLMPELSGGNLGNTGTGYASVGLIKATGTSSGLDPVREAKLRQAVGEFESMLLSSFWKSMKSSFAADGDESSDPAHESLEDWGIQAMSTAVGKAGGLGLGKMILKHLEAVNAANASLSVDLGKPFSAQADKHSESQRSETNH